MVVAALLLVGQVVLLVAVLRTNSKVSDLSDDVGAIDDAAVLSSSDLVDLGSGQASTSPDQAPADESQSPEVAGNLPRFLGDGADAALGRDLSSLVSLEYYTGSTATVDPGDGKARAYMVWAHWCPFCQEELPLMSQWYTENFEDFDNFELISVTTAMDDAGVNPLVPYLDESQFPFPVLFDEDGSLSRQLGANAFPFWVFTAPDGSVVGRAAGLIELDDLTTVFEQLENL